MMHARPARSFGTVFSLSLLFVLAASLASGCIAGTPPTIDCTNADVPAFAEVTAFQVCANCHSEYGSYAGAASHGNQAQNAIAAGDMPTGGYSLTAEQEDALYTWVQCGQPQ